MSRGRPIIDKDRCKGCELCVSACPQKILGMSSDFNAAGVAYAALLDAENCTACKFCGIICPDSAIRVVRYDTEEREV